MRLFNTASQEVEPFVPAHDPVRIYVCGPTVYAPAHLGHAKSYLTFDVLRRWLEFKGHRVRHVQNLTDVADETGERALRYEESEGELTRRFTEEFTTQMKALGNLEPHRLVPASQVVAQTAEVAAHLLERGLAYRTTRDEIFLRAAASEFGELLGADLEAITQIEPGGFEPLDGKENAHDFLLWSPAPSGWQGWESPVGHGRPGWHTECYVIASNELGLPLDIHGGGEDLIFPHHESEQLLARHLHGGEYARHWVHHSLIYDAGGKLSKSRGKHTTLVEIFEGCPPHALRYYLLQHHYRAPTYFDADKLEEACAEGMRLGLTAAEVLAAYPEPGENALMDDTTVAGLTARFEAALDMDLHTDLAVEVLRELDGVAIRALSHKQEQTLEGAAALYRCFQKVLGLFPEPAKGQETQETS